MPEYEMWKQTTNTTGWDIKYYKGLGTSTREEAKEYFADIEEHRKTFIWAGTLALANVLRIVPSLEGWLPIGDSHPMLTSNLT